MITIHHVKESGVKADIHLYCGRLGSCKRTDLIDAKLGNPFVMHNESMRDEVCDAYDKWLHSPQAGNHLRIIERILQRVNEGKVVALYCFCAPKRCHCETIRDYVMTNHNFG